MRAGSPRALEARERPCTMGGRPATRAETAAEAALRCSGGEGTSGRPPKRPAAAPAAGRRAKKRGPATPAVPSALVVPGSEPMKDGWAPQAWKSKEVTDLMQNMSASYLELYTIWRCRGFLASLKVDKALRARAAAQLDHRELAVNSDMEAAHTYGDLRLQFSHTCIKRYPFCERPDCGFCAQVTDRACRHFRSAYFIAKHTFGDKEEPFTGALLHAPCNSPLQVILCDSQGRQCPAPHDLVLEACVLEPDFVSDVYDGETFDAHVYKNDVIKDNITVLKKGESIATLPLTMHITSHSRGETSRFRLGVRVLHGDGPRRGKPNHGIMGARSSTDFDVKMRRSEEFQKPKKLLLTDSLLQANNVEKARARMLTTAVRETLAAAEGGESAANVGGGTDEGEVATVAEFLRAVKVHPEGASGVCLASGVDSCSFEKILAQCTAYVMERSKPRCYARWPEGVDPANDTKAMPLAVLMFDDRQFPFAMVKPGENKGKKRADKSPWKSPIITEIWKIADGTAEGDDFNRLTEEAYKAWLKPLHPGWSLLDVDPFDGRGSAAKTTAGMLRLCKRIDLLRSGLSVGVEEVPVLDPAYEFPASQDNIGASGAPLEGLSQIHELSADEPLPGFGTEDTCGAPTSPGAMPVLSSQDVGMFDCLFEPSSQGEIVGAVLNDLSADFGDVPHMFFEAQQHINEQATADLSTSPRKVEGDATTTVLNRHWDATQGDECEQSDAETNPDFAAAGAGVDEITSEIVRPSASGGDARRRLRHFLRTHVRFTLFQMWGALNNKAVQGTPRLWSKRASKRSRLGQWLVKHRVARARARLGAQFDEHTHTKQLSHPQPDESQDLAAAPRQLSQQGPDDYEMDPALAGDALAGDVSADERPQSPMYLASLPY